MEPIVKKGKKGLSESIEITQCGMEAYESEHRYGPTMSDCFCLHYIFAGGGEYMAGGKRTSLSAGRGFLFFPGEVIAYRAGAIAPWYYGWIGYVGPQAEELTRMAGLTREHPNFAFSDAREIHRIWTQVCGDVSSLRLGGMAAVGGLLRLLSLIGEENPVAEAGNVSQAQLYYRKAVWFIEGNLAHSIKVTDVADFVGLCRSQLFRVFRSQAGCSPQEWIQGARMRKAETLMRDNRLSLQEIALSSGYSDAAQLSDAFRRVKRMSPGAFRKLQAKELS